MKIRRIMIFLVIALLLTGCKAGETRPVYRIDQFKFPYAESGYDNNLDSGFSADDRADDSALQDAVSRIPMEYPLTTEAQLHAYGWALYDVCMELERFDPSFVPCDISLFSDDVIALMFFPSQYMQSYYDGPHAYVLASARDGHIIDFRVGS